LKAQKATEIQTEKAVRKALPKLLPKDNKESLTIVLPYKEPPSYLSKAVRFVDESTIREEEGVPKMTKTRTQQIQLPVRFKE
jgi:hypothetical protein